jgi:hypothetical protein
LVPEIAWIAFASGPERVVRKHRHDCGNIVDRGGADLKITHDVSLPSLDFWRVQGNARQIHGGAIPSTGPKSPASSPPRTTRLPQSRVAEGHYAKAMTRISALWAAIVTGFLSTFVIPAAAWAEQSGVADQLRKSRGIGFGTIGLVCCLVVVAGVVLIVMMIMKSRKR